ncbi:MAG: hypothetical protein HRT77_00560 [Halioglobus sp.]|nr:hypothetical protein [Halioglobus sp.]
MKKRNAVLWTTVVSASALPVASVLAADSACSRITATRPNTPAAISVGGQDNWTCHRCATTMPDPVRWGMTSVKQRLSMLWVSPRLWQTLTPD